MNDDTDIEYINSTDYKKLSDKITNLKDISFDLTAKNLAARKLRYCEIDLEVERNAGHIAPDEIYVSVHVIDSNIRREQSSYIQYITQSPRAVILKDKEDAAMDLSLLENDLTTKLRFDGWQLSSYANIDGFQANGYGIMETVLDQNNPGEIGREYVQYGDFAFIADSRDIQKLEMTGRFYYFTRTKLKSLSELEDPDDRWDPEQVQKILNSKPNDEQQFIFSGTTTVSQSLYKVLKVMFRVKGVVHVAWACPTFCDNWARKPRKLFLGRRKLATYDPAVIQAAKNPQVNIEQLKMIAPTITEDHIEQIKSNLPPSDEEYETSYPYFLYPYLISENDTIANLKGRVYLDQDAQNGASSLLSSLLTKTSRSSGLYFSKDTTDPNANFMMEKNVFFKQGCLINAKVKEMELSAPDPSAFNSINMLLSLNQQETSQVNFAETNRQNDSRKTATAIKSANQQAQELSGVQVTLFSVALARQYTYECEIIKSRVLAGLITVSPNLMPLYQRTWLVKPSGDVDVIQKQQLIQAMMSAWPVIQNTPCAQQFLSDLLEKMFPDSAPKYIQAFKDAQQQQQSQQAQNNQQKIAIAHQAGQGISHLADHPEYFSEVGRIHAYPKIEVAAEQYKQMTQQK